MLDTCQKIMSQDEAVSLTRAAQAQGKKVVFTNGCFDLLHAGHVDLLNRARSLGDLLILGLNSDEGVRAQNKGPERPIVPQDQRAAVVAGLQAVDAVVFFSKPTPEELIEAVAPDVLVKGGDWPEDKIVGAAYVRSRGGQVHSLPLVPGLSTTALVSKLKTSCP
ncbi:MAG: D-glycero-beta-D-manno-heptose 1-phosphate adenylyltransferase [Deltaproteobacteria bacterium]|nr:D-glycero-beta-D-manno-heptose 1-phosphate adenylyltransferase [Deltaproteobacteria bacterium]